ncbi:MAG: hypothetical protein JXB26_06730 [Candidatus Aminicenantes bacterium]|nr:hypothetical protein [Candidatus Aminicenantes bacterium]
MKNLTAGALLILLCTTAHAGEWTFLGFWKTYGKSFRNSPFNPAGHTVALLGYTPGPDMSLSSYMSLEGGKGNFWGCLDVKAGLDFNSGESADVHLKLHQLYLQKDIGKHWVIVAGRIIQRWGTGFAYNPTDVAAPEKNLGDPDNSEKNAVGLDMIKLEYFGESSSAALCLLMDIKTDPALKIKNPGCAFRIYKNFFGIDISGVALFKHRQKPVWGMNFAAVFGERLELHGEMSVRKGIRPAFLLEDGFLSMPSAEGAFSPPGSRKTGFLLAGLLGFQITLPGNVLWVGEIYHRSEGYTRKEWREIVTRLDSASKQNEYPQVFSGGDIFLKGLEVFDAKGAMRNYVLNHFRIPLRRVGDIRLTWFINCSDKSFLLMPEIYLDAGNFFTFYARSIIFQGKEDSEFGGFFQDFYWEMGVRFRS